MTTPLIRRQPGPDSGPAPDPLWSVPLPTDAGGVLTVDAFGGCLVSTVTAITAYAPDGQRVWESPIAGRAPDALRLAPDRAPLQIEGELLVTRHPGTGAVRRSFPVPRGTDLALAPWGDLLYVEVDPRGVATLHCVTRDGRHRWSLSLTGGAAGPEPFALADLMIVQRRGALWAIDREGTARWIADPAGVRPPRPEDDQPRPTTGPEAGVEIGAMPVHLDPARALVELEWYSGRGQFVLDAAAPQITPIGTPQPLYHPYAVLPAPAGGIRVVGRGGPVEVIRMRKEYPVVAVDPDGTQAWEHRLVTQARTLNPAGADRLIVAASPTVKRWRDYHKWYDLSVETFVRCLAGDGSVRWTWYAPGPLTHLPVVAPTGTVYVGCEGTLWALPVG